jgi:23S rRNA pseudouridine1911/1915/1917 synthase
VVHPAKGHWAGTLASALAYRYGQLSCAGGGHRPGIVHRLDCDTSGALVVARTEQAHAGLARQFAARSVQKQYVAIVVGVPDRDHDVIRRSIGVHPRQREKMAIRVGHVTSRDAETVYRVVDRFDGYARLLVEPRTGRTHQIRVHLSSIGYPVLCDRRYGGQARITVGQVQHQADLNWAEDPATVLLERQALHACRLALVHPVSGQPLAVEAPLPADLETVLAALRRYRER